MLWASDNSTSLRQEHAGLWLAANHGMEKKNGNYRGYEDSIRLKGLGFQKEWKRKWKLHNWVIIELL